MRNGHVGRLRPLTPPKVTANAIEHCFAHERFVRPWQQRALVPDLPRIERVGQHGPQPGHPERPALL